MMINKLQIHQTLSWKKSKNPHFNPSNNNNNKTKQLLRMIIKIKKQYNSSRVTLGLNCM